MLEEYFKDIFNTTKTGDATEESYYPDLKRLIEAQKKYLLGHFLIASIMPERESLYDGLKPSMLLALALE